MFGGEFDEFNARWFAVVGVSIVITMIANTLVPSIAPLAQFCIIRPLKRWKAYKNAASQYEVNQASLGPKFKIATRYPLILNTVFVVMTFSSGMPVLYPLAIVALFTTYWVEKTTLFRMFQKPPHYDASLAELSASLLPWALAFRECNLCASVVEQMNLTQRYWRSTYGHPYLGHARSGALRVCSW